jgi:hypothetical protein
MQQLFNFRLESAGFLSFHTHQITSITLFDLSLRWKARPYGGTLAKKVKR